MTNLSKRYLKWLSVIIIPLFFIAACSQKGGLRPPEPTVISDQIIAGQPQLVTFAELEADPTRYQDKLIRVTGSYISLPVVACSPYSGPNPAWALVADDLRLDTLGFDGLLFQLAQQETTLTLDGVLRRYDGPLGCGKRPSAGILWYLEALQIVQPNPLVLADSDLGDGTVIIPPPFPTGTPPAPAIEETPTPEPTTGPGTPTRTPSPTSVSAPTTAATATLAPGSSPTAEPDSTATRTPTPTRTLTPIPTGTAVSGTSTPTPTPSRTPAPGPTNPPLPTSTPGDGYPVSTNTPYP